MEIDQGRSIGPVGAYRLAAERARPLFGAIAIIVAVVSLLLSSLVLVPIAVWLAVRWALAVFAVELKGCPRSVRSVEVAAAYAAGVHHHLALDVALLGRHAAHSPGLDGDPGHAAGGEHRARLPGVRRPPARG